MGNLSEKTAPLPLDGKHLDLENIVKYARLPFTPLRVSEASLKTMKKSRDWVNNIQLEGKPVVYGVNTGFGSKATVSIDKEKLKDLQRNLIMSHAAGTGNPLSIDVVRAAMIMRINTFIKGYSGVRVELVNTMIQMLEKGVTPYIPEQGSLGASGDLAPLSHMALVISQGVERDYEQESGMAYFFNKKQLKWELLTGLKAMEKAGIPRLVLEAKEGLALNNGTQISTALLAMTLYDAKILAKQADIAMSMTLEALEGISSAYSDDIHRLRPHQGQIDTAENIRRIIKNSHLIDRHPEKVQDAYSVRCHPQVMGGIRESLRFIEKIVQTEMNSTTDNPIILPEIAGEDKAVSGGNFHAQPIAFAADLLAIVLCEIASIAERRIFRLSDKNLNGGLPSFLITNSGLDSGLMLAQYTAAALVSENKSLAHPASIDSIPTCENQEDHVSMAPVAARKAKNILQNAQKVVAIELFYAAQALDFRLEKKHMPEELLGEGTLQAYNLIRKKIPFMEKDRPIYPHINTATRLVENGEVAETVEAKIGKLL